MHYAAFVAQAQVRVTLKANGGMPRDHVVNTWAVQGATPGTNDASIVNAFVGFYNDVQPGASLSVASFISPLVQRANGIEVELIEDPQTVPAVPYHTAVASLGAANSDPLPMEIAVCLSFKDAQYATSDFPGRHRGRVYIGPLCEDAMTNTSSVVPPYPSDAFVSVLIDAAEDLFTTAGSLGFEWAIWSRAAASFFNVDGGWVDNDFDTQRRRQRAASSRTIWGNP